MFLFFPPSESLVPRTLLNGFDEDGNKNKRTTAVIYLTRLSCVWTQLALFEMFLYSQQSEQRKIMELLPNLTLSVSTRARATHAQTQRNVSHVPSNCPWLRHGNLASSCALISGDKSIAQTNKQNNERLSLASSLPTSTDLPLDASCWSNRLDRTFQNFLFVGSFSI